MFSFFQRFREPLIVGALLVVPLLTYLTKGHRGREPNVIDRLVLAASRPVQVALTAAIEGLSSTASSYVALRGAHEDAHVCRTELAETKAELNALNEAKAENARLKGLLGYVDGTIDQEIVARVIGLNPSAQYLSIRIDRGEDHGVRVGMPVVTADGVVGQVVRAVGASADVMLLTDPASRIGGVAQRSRVRGAVMGAGDGRRLALNLVRREDDIQEGDTIVTAGSDGIFPRGLMVGTARSIARPSVGMFLTGVVVPSVDLSKLEEVVIIPVTMGAPVSATLKEGPR
jgi:rod shape-determining protein MreC